MNIETFKTNMDGTCYILTCIASEEHVLSSISFYKDMPTSASTTGYTYDLDEQVSVEGLEIEMPEDSGINAATDFVYAKITETDGHEETSKIVCTFYEKRIINKLIACIDTILGDNSCGSISAFNMLYMKFKAVVLAVRTGNFEIGEKYFYKFFNENSTSRTGGCNCHA